MRTSIYDNYQKVCRVIESCENETHLKSARTYVNLFLEKYSAVQYEDSIVRGPEGHTFKTKYIKKPTFSITYPMYEELLLVLEHQETRVKNG